MFIKSHMSYIVKHQCYHPFVCRRKEAVKSPMSGDEVIELLEAAVYLAQKAKEAGKPYHEIILGRGDFNTVELNLIEQRARSRGETIEEYLDNCVEALLDHICYDFGKIS